MSRTAAFVLIITMVSPAAGAVAAQEVPRAFRGLFRASDTPANSRHRVDLGTTFYAAYYEAELEEAPALPDGFDLPLYSSTELGTTPVLQYAFIGQRRVFGTVAAGSFSRTGNVDWRGTRFYSHTRFATPVGPRTRVELRGLASYTPFYRFDLSIDPERDETDLLPPVEGQAMAVRSTTFFDVVGHWRHRATERSEISVSGGLGYTHFSDEGINSLTPSASLRYSKGLTEHMRLQLGYGFRQWSYADAAVPIVRSHDLITGISYARSLPFARRTQVGFDIGSAIAQTPDAWRYDLNGGVFVLQPIGRGWVSVGSYRRGLDARAGLSSPLYLFGDTAALTVSGTVARRLVLYTTATYVSGSSLFDELSERSSWWSASTSASTLVFGLAAVYIQAGWTGQRFSAQVGRVTGLPTVIDRFSVSGGFSVGLPLVR